MKQVKYIVGGLVVGVILYQIFNSKKKSHHKKRKDMTPESKSFAGDEFFNFNEPDFYIAKRYDENHVNDDGSVGATFMAFNNSDLVGIWKEGVVDLGTKITA